jgi:hypothetical protein
MVETDVRPLVKRPWAWMPEEAISRKNQPERPALKLEDVVEEEKPKTLHAVDTISLFENLSDVGEPKTKSQRLKENFQRRQYAYLLGRRSDRDIHDDEGNVIVRKGQLIDEEIIILAKKSGKFMQLAVSSRQKR